MRGIWKLFAGIIATVAMTRATPNKRLSNLQIDYRGAQVLRVKVTKAFQRSDLMTLQEDQSEIFFIIAL